MLSIGKSMVHKHKEGMTYSIANQKAQNTYEIAMIAKKEKKKKP